MLNQVVIAGRLVGNPKIEESEEGKKIVYIVVAVPRNYKNVDGTYDTDFIKCTLWNGIAENVIEYCKKGDVIGINGRLQTDISENEDGTKNKIMTVIAEKVSFLSSRKSEEE